MKNNSNPNSNLNPTTLKGYTPAKDHPPVKSKPPKITKKSIVKKGGLPGELDIVKIKELLASEYPTVRADVCRVLAEGLKSMKPIVCEGEVFSEIDYPTRLKYADAITDLLGEKDKDAEKGEYHIHFTNVLQHIRQYEREVDREERRRA